MDLQALLAQMTLDEKIGQLRQAPLTSVYSGAGNEITGEEQDNVAQAEKHQVGSTLGFFTAKIALKLQKEHMEHDRNKIPMLFMRDIVHGHTTIYPIPLAMGCTFDPELMEQCCAMASKEAAASGLHVTFTPMVDYVRDGRWGRVMETCGEDPYLNGVMGAAQVRGFQGKDLKNPEALATCVKHFAGYGGAEGGRDYNNAEMSEYTLREYYLPAYKACLDAGSTMVMPSFNTINGIPATGNSYLMNDILRNEWGFDGVVISDYGAIGGLKRHGQCENGKDAVKTAINCHCDIDMCSGLYHAHLKNLIEEGAISMEQIDTAVLRVLKLKQRLGLFENPYHGASEEKEQELFLCRDHRELVRSAAEKAAVLLKNNGVLPFSEDTKRIALIGPFAEDKKILGSWAASGKPDDVVTMLDGVRRLLPNAEITVSKGCSYLWYDTDTSGIGEAVEAAKNADAVILCVGEYSGYSGESFSRVDTRLPGVQEELVNRVCAANPNTAVVLFNGRPLVLSGIQNAPAILEMWMPGTEGGNAAARLLFGRVNPSGKLTMSFPKHTGQYPLYYNCARTSHNKNFDNHLPKQQGIYSNFYSDPNKEHEYDDMFVLYRSGYIDCGSQPLYSFGHGLSYTEFEYRNLQIDRDIIHPGESITVKITVANTGKMAGREVVQLYMRDHYGSTVRPIQELIDFTSLWLEPGEEKTVSFTVDESKLIMWTAEGKFDTETGKFSLYTGYADHLLLEKQFELVK